jgi:hypothetical protein
VVDNHWDAWQDYIDRWEDEHRPDEYGPRPRKGDSYERVHISVEAEDDPSDRGETVLRLSYVDGEFDTALSNKALYWDERNRTDLPCTADKRRDRVACPDATGLVGALSG